MLGAYSMYNTEVGYCQGMSQIAALLLMYLNEEVCVTGLESFNDFVRYIDLSQFACISTMSDCTIVTIKTCNGKV